VKRDLSQAILLAILAAGCGGSGENRHLPFPEAATREDTLFVTIPGGVFTNTSGEQVQVETFEIMVYEVSNRLYAGAAEAAGVENPPDPCFPGIDDYMEELPGHPVVNISPEEASRVAQSLGLRLPTLDEWEYAASWGLSGDISEQFPWGELAPGETPGIPANYLALDEWKSRDADGFAYTAPGGAYPLTTAGMADMGGNVAEFTRGDSSWVLKGGSWAQPEDAMRLEWSRNFSAGDRCWYAGCRFAR
jgi:formylglycine-generating enzyme required for sulfatase activity